MMIMTMWMTVMMLEVKILMKDVEEEPVEEKCSDNKKLTSYLRYYSIRTKRSELDKKKEKLESVRVPLVSILEIYKSFDTASVLMKLHLQHLAWVLICVPEQQQLLLLQYVFLQWRRMWDIT